MKNLAYLKNFMEEINKVIKSEDMEIFKNNHGKLATIFVESPDDEDGFYMIESIDIDRAIGCQCTQGITIKLKKYDYKCLDEKLDVTCSD